MGACCILRVYSKRNIAMWDIVFTREALTECKLAQFQTLSTPVWTLGVKAYKPWNMLEYDVDSEGCNAIIIIKTTVVDVLSVLTLFIKGEKDNSWHFIYYNKRPTCRYVFHHRQILIKHNFVAFSEFSQIKCYCFLSMPQRGPCCITWRRRRFINLSVYSSHLWCVDLVVVIGLGLRPIETKQGEDVPVSVFGRARQRIVLNVSGERTRHMTNHLQVVCISIRCHINY